MRVKDLLLYCGIGVAVAATAIVAGIYRARAGATSNLTVNWLGFAIMTALVFGNAIRNFKHLWAARKFWRLLILFVVAHVILGVLLLSRITNIGLIQFAVATPIEYFALMSFLKTFLKDEE
jgi:hypothetical protein